MSTLTRRLPKVAGHTLMATAVAAGALAVAPTAAHAVTAPVGPATTQRLGGYDIDTNRDWRAGKASYTQGQSLTLLCHERSGEPVTGYYDGSSDIYYLTADGGWVADIDLATGTYDPIAPNCTPAQKVAGFKKFWLGRQAEYTPWAETNTPDNLYQCADLWKIYADQVNNASAPPTGGNGGAKNIWLLNSYDTSKFYKVSKTSTPQPGDVAVFGATTNNVYGHVSIVTGVSGTTVYTIEQNGFAAVADRKVTTGTVNKSTLLGYLRPVG